MFEKLKINKEFRRVYGRGKSYVNPLVVSYIMKTRGDEIRIGITVSKKLGTAVMRNRAKRVITAAFRQCLPNISTGYDIVFVARSRILTAKSSQVAAVIKSHLILAGAWNENDK